MEALEKHWITAASILVPCPWFPEVARWAKAHPDADLGVHLDLNSEWTAFRWSPVSPQGKGSSLLDEDGYLPLTTEYVAAKARPGDVEVEARAQIDKAQAAGIHLSHLDTHMATIVATAELFKVYLGLGRSSGLPVLLEHRDVGDQLTVGRGDEFYGVPMPPGSVLVDKILQLAPGVPASQWMEAYKKLLSPLPPGSYQLIVHLAYNDEEMQGATWDHPDWGAQWRQNDLDTVRSAEFQRFLKDQGFILVSWRELANALPADWGAAGQR